MATSFTAPPPRSRIQYGFHHVEVLEVLLLAKRARYSFEQRALMSRSGVVQLLSTKNCRSSPILVAALVPQEPNHSGRLFHESRSCLLPCVSDSPGPSPAAPLSFYRYRCVRWHVQCNFQALF